MTLPKLHSQLARPLRPPVSDFTKPFWDELATGQFTTTRCQSCDQLAYPPRPVCSSCGSQKTRWETVSGRGILYSRTRVHAAGAGFAALTPYAIGVVDLVERVRLVTRLLPECGSLALDESVQLVVVQHLDGPLFAATRP